MTDDVRVDQDGAVLVITIDRPARRNAMTRAGALIIAAALDELDRRDDLRVGILTGAGGTFCAGMDLKGFLAGELPSVQGRGFGGLTQAPPTKPLIAAVEGYALAGGFELVLACDLVVAGRGAKFGLPEVRRGLLARGGGLLRLPERVSLAVAMEVALTGEMLGAERAASLGLVNRVTADGEALVQALDLASSIVANAPLAVVASKQIMVQSRAWSADERFSRQSGLSDPVFASKDAREGAQAFAEKRPPIWLGR